MSSRWMTTFCAVSCVAAVSTAPVIGQALPSVREGYAVSIFTDGLRRPLGISFAPDGALIVCTWDGGDVYSVDADGVKTLLNYRAKLDFASQPVVTPDGRVFVTAGGTNDRAKIWEIVEGSPTLFYEGKGAYGIELGRDGSFYFTQSPTGSILRSGLDGSATVFASGLNVGLAELLFGPDGFLYAANDDNGTIYRIDSGGRAEPYLTDLPRPEMVAFDPDGMLYFTAFTSSTVYSVNSQKQAEVFLTAGPSTDIRGIAFDGAGNLFACDDMRGFVYRIEKLPPAPRFSRGDANTDGRLDVSDPLSVLNYLFSDGRLACSDAGDADDDGTLNITDAIGVLGFLFLGTFAPRPPFPDCGVDATDDGLGCEASLHCSG